MKYLYLLRHAHALKKQGEIDIERNLSDLGIKQANEIGNYLNSQPQIDLIKLSISKRTQETYSNLCKTLRYHPQSQMLDELYYADPDDIVKTIQDTDDNINSLMILSHNPGITQVINYLDLIASEQQLKQALNFEPTAKLVLIEYNGKKWADVAATKNTIKTVYYPQ